MRFRWNGKGSKIAFVNSAAIRAVNRGINVDQAMALTIHHHSTNSELLSDETLRRLRNEISDRLKAIEREKARRGGKRTAG